MNIRELQEGMKRLIRSKAKDLALSTKLKLTKREKTYVTAGISAFTIFIIFQFVLFPFFDAKAKIKNSIRANEKILEEMISLSSEYKSLKSDGDVIQRNISIRSQDFTLFSFLEKQAGRAGIKSNIKYMKPSTSTEAGPYKQSSVEMRLDDVSLKQLVDYLYYIESRENLVSVKRISIKQGRSKPEYLTVLMQVITYE